jgi:alpha-D-ribose 1-methylphosphonate 5-triphosphate synthase subunit PhnG
MGFSRTACANSSRRRTPSSSTSRATSSASIDPPAHAVVLSVDEKSQIQALDRTQPGLPMKRGRAGTMTHDYKRHGTTTLFAAMNVLDGTVIGHNMQRHRHQEFIRFSIAGRARGSSRKDRPRHPRQLCRPPASGRAAMAGAPSALDVPLHADLSLLAQRRRGLLRHPNEAASPARRLPISRRPPSGDQSVPRRPQRPVQALRVDRRSRQNQRRRQTRASSVRFDPLVRTLGASGPLGLSLIVLLGGAKARTWPL